jgi:hypothetical protein
MNNKHASALLLLLDLFLVLYLLAYLLGLVPHNPFMEFLLDGIRKGMH